MKNNEQSSSSPNQLPPYPPPYWQTYGSEEDISINFLEIWRTLMKYKWWILLFSVSAIISAILYTRSPLAKQYKATVTFLIFEPGANRQSQLGGLASLAGIDLSVDRINNIDILMHSRSFTEKIIKDLNLLPLIYKEAYESKTNSYAMEKQPTPLDATGVLLGAVKRGSQGGAQSLSVVWEDPDMAAKIANYYLVAFEEYISENNFTAGQKKVQFLRRQLEKTEIYLRKAEGALREFNIKNNFAAVSARMEVMKDHVGAMLKERMSTEITRESLIHFQGKNSLEVQKMELQMQVLDKQIESLMEELAKRADKYGNLVLDQSLLEQNLKIYSTIYQSFRTQIETNNIQASVESDKITVIDSALPPKAPFTQTPKRLLNVIISGIVALLVGCFFAFFVEFVRNKIHQEKQRETI